MTEAPFAVERLTPSHSRRTFTCNVAVLERYLHDQAMQDVRRLITRCFVAIERATGVIAGYYTLSATVVVLSDLPAELVRRLPRYPEVPAILLGRLAIATAFQGRGLGGALLADALRRAVAAEIGAYAVIVDAKDESAAAFYRHHGFLSIGTRPRRLFLPIVAIVRDGLPDL